MIRALVADAGVWLDAPRRFLLERLGAPRNLRAPLGWLTATLLARGLHFDYVEAYLVGRWLPGALRGVYGANTQGVR